MTCDLHIPFGDLTDEQIDQQVEAVAATFVGLPTVIGAPLLMAEEVWREVARHQLELGVRLCACAPPIKTYTAPTPEEALDVGTAAGRWTYDEAYRDVETPRERIVRLAREQREAFEAEVARRRARGDLPPA